MKIKFLTLNILWGGFLSDSILDFIVKEDPDICTFQEVKQNDLIDKIKNNTRLTHSKFSTFYIHAEGQSKSPIGNMTLSNFNFKGDKTLFFNRQKSVNEIYTRTTVDSDPTIVPRGIQHTQIMVSDKMLNIFNVHGIWGHDGLDSDLRLKMSDIIIKMIKDKENIILAGDFNMFPNTQSINKIEKYLKNVFKNELTTTFNVKRKTNPGNWSSSVVDMLFVSPNIKVLDHYCPQVDVSDHLPLVSTLEVA